jgi:hypothetical protein
MLTKSRQKSPQKFQCETCDYICSKQSDFAKHLATQKHAVNNVNISVNTNVATGYMVCANCQKGYKSRVGLWKHGKICLDKNNRYKNEPPTPSVPPKTGEILHMNILTSLVIDVVKNNSELQRQNSEYQKQNTDLQKQMLDVCKNMHQLNITNTNSNNKTFNLQFFLNEECKDAMNIMDFVDSFALQLSDLESVGKLGYVEGISRLIINKLSELDVHKRPIHCTDAKREIMHVKDNNKWERESADNTRLKKAIKYISKKNSNLLVAWSDANPGSKHIHDNANDNYMQLIVQAMGGTGEIVENENKIIRKIAREVLITKV